MSRPKFNAGDIVEICGGSRSGCVGKIINFEFEGGVGTFGHVNFYRITLNDEPGKIFSVSEPTLKRAECHDMAINQKIIATNDFINWECCKLESITNVHKTLTFIASCWTKPLTCRIYKYAIPFSKENQHLLQNEGVE